MTNISVDEVKDVNLEEQNQDGFEDVIIIQNILIKDYIDLCMDNY